MYRQNHKLLIISLKIFKHALIETLHKALYSNLVKTNAQKIIITRTITKLQMQKEILELLQSDDVEESIKNLKAATERMGKKSQSAIRKVS